jgi:hypothetical protein
MIPGHDDGDFGVHAGEAYKREDMPSTAQVFLSALAIACVIAIGIFLMCGGLTGCAALKESAKRSELSVSGGAGNGAQMGLTMPLAVAAPTPQQLEKGGAKKHYYPEPGTASHGRTRTNTDILPSLMPKGIADRSVRATTESSFGGSVEQPCVGPNCPLPAKPTPTPRPIPVIDGLGRFLLPEPFFNDGLTGPP